jgi:predicted nucleotidyltransferase
MAIPERWKGHRPLPPEIKSSLEELTPIFEREGVILAYIFGSLAKTGDAAGRGPQDVDLALLTREKPVWKLWDEIADALGTDRLDIVDLRRASPVLLFEIVRTGRPIYASDKAAREAFVLDVLHLYRDTAPLRRRQRAALKRRIDRWCEESR